MIFPIVKHSGVAITFTSSSDAQMELAEPKSPDSYHDAEVVSAAEQASAESLV